MNIREHFEIWKKVPIEQWKYFFLWEWQKAPYFVAIEFM